MNREQIFQAYSDASGLFAHRFQSIGIISGNIDTLEKLRRGLEEILDNEEKSEYIQGSTKFKYLVVKVA